LTKLFSKFGWNKKLSELTEEEITSTVLIMQFSKRIKEDEQYTKQYLDKLLLKYVHEKEEETIRDEDLPF
jgi:ABC-type transporter MlaC component|tara:strand:+ start:740 stop:949 length:210 start_codon:yes stop_codon:yes gene_type:complete